MYMKAKGISHKVPGRKPQKKNRRPRRDMNTPVRQRQPRRVGVTGMRTSASKADIEQFRLALCDPFNVKAIGARVIDSYTLPTATYHVRGSMKLITNSTGDCIGAFLPNPCFAYVGTGVNGGGNDPLQSNGWSKFTENPITTFAASPGGAYLISPTTLNTVLTEYRVVSWGVRFLAKDTAMASKGKVYLAVVPTTENAPSWNTMETVTGTDISIGEYTIGMPLTNIAGIVNLPGVRTFSMQDLLRGEVMVCGTPTNPVFYTFKGTADRSNTTWNTGQVLADEGVFNNTTGLVNATAGGRKDVASLRGGRAVLFCISGAPAATNELDVEIVYHLEGTPNIASANSGQLIPSSMRPSAGSTALVEKAMAVASAASVVFQYITDPANVTAATRALAFLGL